MNSRVRTTVVPTATILPARVLRLVDGGGGFRGQIKCFRLQAMVLDLLRFDGKKRPDAHVEGQKGDPGPAGPDFLQDLFGKMQPSRRRRNRPGFRA